MAKHDRDAEKEQYWRLVLEEFGASELNVREFCRREGLREPSFYAWRRELNQRDGVATSSIKPKAAQRTRNGKAAQARKSASAPAAPTLVEVMTRPVAGSQTIEIETPAGFTIRLGQEVDDTKPDTLLSCDQSANVGFLILPVSVGFSRLLLATSFSWWEKASVR